jgi:uncharacterized protein YndB with AHSA1/START domain
VTDTLPGTISTVHGYDLPVGRDEVWEQISAVDNYRSWWPWLRRFDAAGLDAGTEWRCEVQPPLPYIVRFRVAIEKVDPPALVHALVLGDVVGDATLELEEAESGCRAVLHSALAPGNAALRLVSRFASPLARFGHDWVLDSGARQFIARAAPPRPVD